MATIHFILQGKGGVGKSMVASLLYQTLLEKNIPVMAFDTDPVNKTLSGYKDFKVTEIEIMKNGDINPRNFDALYGALLETADHGHIIVDNGASSFVALGNYLKVNEAFPTLIENGHTVYLHTLITGGQALSDTITGLNHLIQSFSDIPLVVWLNPFFGEIVYKGNSFEEMPIYVQYSDKMHALIKLPETNPHLEGQDLAELFTAKQSFADAIATKPIVIRGRIKRYWQKIMQLIDDANLIQAGDMENGGN